MSTPPPPSEYLQGVVERVTYHADTSGYSVLRLKVAGERDLITVVGTFATVEAGQTLRCRGTWRTHSKHGRQFVAQSAQELKPATALGIERYLGSGLIKGIGPKTAAKIVARFGLETLNIIEQTPERLLEVPSTTAAVGSGACFHSSTCVPLSLRPSAMRWHYFVLFHGSAAVVLVWGRSAWRASRLPGRPRR
jgi:hypothetical protein